MGFCRRCGDIVAGARCKCGGTAVAPVVPWNQSDPKERSQDRWSKTYVSRERSPTRPLSCGPPLKPHMTGSSEATSIASTHMGSFSPGKRFPRPGPSPDLALGQGLGNPVSAHIASTTSYINRPLSPLKFSTTLPAPESDILPSLAPNDTTLSKVYGSVLQPKESLTKHACGICTNPFSPDATIYPNPSTDGDGAERFLCRSCFTINGGSKGTCPTCSRPVLTLKAEGGFIHAAEKYWHKRCFNCAGCHKNIGNSPMVDLLGRPSCVDCFDNCLTREPNTPMKNWNTNSPRSDANVNIGGMNAKAKNTHPGREASPALGELEQRLGIVKSREGSPALEELSQRLNMIGRERYIASGSSPITSPASKHNTPSRDTSPLTDRARGRRDSRPDGSLSPIRRYDRFKSPDHDHVLRSTPIKYSPGGPSPVRNQATGSPAPTQEAIEEMKQRFLKNSSPARTTEDILISTRPLRPTRSSTSLREASKASSPASLPAEPTSPRSPAPPATPDLIPDFSDTMTQSSWSGPDSPPRNDTNGDTDLFSVPQGSRYIRGDYLDHGDSMIMEETNSQLGTPIHTPKSDKLTSKSPLASTPSRLPRPTKSVTSPSSSISSTSITSPPKLRGLNIPPSLNGISGSAICARCQGALFSVQDNGKYVTIPADAKDGKPQTYHRECFRCMVCEGVFRESGQGQAVFVKANGGPCHVECAPPQKVIIRKLPSVSSLQPSSSDSSIIPPVSTSSSHATSSRYEIYERPPVTAPGTQNTFPRFGTRTACPGCHKSVSPMEFGVVPGPQGTRWHSSCLICGGKKSAPQPWNPYRPREEKKRGEPGCGKKLDSAAKGDGEGGIWCRECLLLLGIGGSPQASPTREPLVSSFTGSSSKLVSQSTGTTTLARQFTGLGGDGLSRQLTGNGFAPTRSVSPTKQLGHVGMGPGTRPRPKSVIGMRNTKSIDEGRGMFLVRQLTGGASNWAE